MTPLTHPLLCELKGPGLGMGLERWPAGIGPEQGRTLIVQANRIFSKTQEEILYFVEAAIYFSAEVALCLRWVRVSEIQICLSLQQWRINGDACHSKRDHLTHGAALGLP